MPATETNRCFRLRRRPDGAVTAADLELCEEPLGEVGDGQALIRTLLLSIDPTNRIWMSELRGYMPPVPLDGVMRGLGIGEVVASRHPDLPVGALVSGLTGFQEYCLHDDATAEAPFTVLPSPPPAPLEKLISVLGHTGITAYLGLEKFGKPQPGETVVVSAAAGAVGSVAGQLAKIGGARVVGIAGGPEKCRMVVEELGFDACVDYKAGDWREQLAAATPDGIDVDFENVGGEIMDEVFSRLNFRARVVLCGMISQYDKSDAAGAWAGQTQIGQMIMQRVRMEGFVVLDHADEFEAAIGALAPLLADGRLKSEETVIDGIEHARDALGKLFAGENTGKVLVRVSEPTAA